jgi:hypothetical protein
VTRRDLICSLVVLAAGSRLKASSLAAKPCPAIDVDLPHPGLPGPALDYHGHVLHNFTVDGYDVRVA